jgi:adenylate cyclase
MGEDDPPTENTKSERWRKSLLVGHGSVERRLYRMAPNGPRCAICFAPFHGVGGKVFSIFGFRPSRKNPRFCSWCFERGPHGGAEVDAGILFADIRGFTSFSESRSPAEVAKFLNRFYRLASDVLVSRGAIIDKLSGDGVMAIFVPGFSGEDFVTNMVLSAEELMRGAGFIANEEAWLPIGIGLDQGTAFVGNIGAGDVKDFTAIGDVVNTASRLQAVAGPGQIVMSERVFTPLAHRYAHAQTQDLALRGKAEAFRAHIVSMQEEAAHSA